MSKINDYYCTVDEYFELSKKMKENLTPIEEIKIINFENFITLAEQNEDFVSNEVLNILNEYRQKRALLISPENEKNDNKIIQFKSFPKTPTDKVEEKVYTRKLSKTGYINASIMLIVILNIGFIVALTMIFMR